MIPNIGFGMEILIKSIKFIFIVFFWVGKWGRWEESGKYEMIYVLLTTEKKMQLQKGSVAWKEVNKYSSRVVNMSIECVLIRKRS